MSRQGQAVLEYHNKLLLRLFLLLVGSYVSEVSAFTATIGFQRPDAVTKSLPFSCRRRDHPACRMIATETHDHVNDDNAVSPLPPDNQRAILSQLQVAAEAGDIATAEACFHNNRHTFENLDDDADPRAPYHALLQAYAMGISRQTDPDDDSVVLSFDDILERMYGVLNLMVDGTGPTATPDSYVWLLEAFLLAKDPAGGYEIWESLVYFAEVQPAFSLTPRLHAQNKRLVSLENDGVV